MNEATWTVPPDHPAFAGHFPGRPIVPGVVLLDRAVAFITSAAGCGAAGCTIANAKFPSPAGPGETLRFRWQACASGAVEFSVDSGERAVAAGRVTLPQRP